MRDHIDIWGPLYFIFGVPALMFLIALATGCGGELIVPICEAPEVDSSVAAIVDGELSTDRRATVKVLTAGNRYCSGTALGPFTVLTAAHCKGPEAVIIGTQRYEVAYSETHERFAFPQADLQIVYLDRPAPGPFASIAENFDECSSLLVQGYGQGSDGELHERVVYGWHTGERGILLVTEGTCFGDSGSGLYTRSEPPYEIGGTLSFGTTDDCYDSNGGFVDLTLHRDWIRARLNP